MSKKQIARAMLRYWDSTGEAGEWGKPTEHRRRFTLWGANSFVVGVLLDQQVKAERAWAAAEWIVDSIGDDKHPFWETVSTMEKRNLKGFMRYGWGGQAFHRHWRKMAENLQKCAEIMIDKYGGDPRNIWNNQREVSEVRDRFEQLPGIGRALSRMAVLILARDYGLLGGMTALAELDVKPDNLLKRVFKRTGLVSSNPPFDEFVEIARQLSPDFPAALDPPAWQIGREFCKPSKPNCKHCPLDRYCPKIGL